MIPDLPPSCSDTERLDFFDKLLGNLEDQSVIHTHWHTHRQNPSTCWICDMVTLSRKVMYIADKFIPKSTLDMVTELSSEDDSDAEIEDEFLNKNDEPPEFDESDPLNNEPEYDVVDADSEDTQ